MPGKNKERKAPREDKAYVPLGSGGAERAERAIIDRKTRTRDAAMEAFKYASGQRKTKPK